ncbi:universal stress protein [Actinomadura sp. ATCC 31491]|uniref:Universal stress protein n=1 Tax=Actinomadura luzonensis TaxID=2805427 RepID=A0ABT0G2H9_9ACTN|nr:universal stress protein [Actinomadura luzonensis]MCK2218323.1 universal stress protein [Actinomadura luzonensis]
MIRRILLAVDDSPTALKAARLAVALAAATRAELRVLHAVEDHVLTDAVGRVSTARDVARRREVSAENVLRVVSELARDAGVTARTTLRGGGPVECVLAEARSWEADLVVVGIPDDARPGAAAAVIEFADQPVLVVPGRRPPGGPSG